MCNFLIQISPQFGNRTLYRCEHASFHLAWERGMLHMSEEEIIYLHSVLFQPDPIENPPEAQPGIRLFPHMANDGTTHYELWVAENGLRLSIADLDVLRMLLGYAAEWLERRSVPNIPPPQNLLDYSLQEPVRRYYLN